jgi:hypothetical protein
VLIKLIIVGNIVNVFNKFDFYRLTLNDKNGSS